MRRVGPVNRTSPLHIYISFVFLTFWSRQITSADLFFVFHARKSFVNPSEFLLHKTNRLHFSVRVYCNRSQKTSRCVKNNSHAARLRLVSYFFVLCKEQKSSVIYYSTHTRKNVIYLFNNIVNCMLSDLYAAEILIINYIFIKVFMKRNFRLWFFWPS